MLLELVAACLSEIPEHIPSAFCRMDPTGSSAVECLWPAEQVKQSSSPPLKAEAFGHIAKDSFEIWSHCFTQFQCVWLCCELFSFHPPMLWAAFESSLNMPVVFDGKYCLQGAMLRLSRVIWACSRYEAGLVWGKNSYWKEFPLRLK